MTGIVLLILRILLAVLLYGFLGWALYILWRDLRRQAELLERRQARPLRLVFETGEASASRRFTKSEVIIGRSPACDYLLDDKTVSARHSRLAYHHGQWWLEDLASTNGTFLNGEPVSAPVVLASGDQLRCGQVTGVVEIE
jgi:pSer/pThr/pTyr-binding forkhead associated (FHA) protein